MLFLHEEHEVRGLEEAAFDAAYRDEWIPTLARTDDARLLYFLRHVHGTGPSYQVVTITAVRDGAAWERLADRMATGDLAAWAQKLDGLRHEVHGKILQTLPWSPLQDIDFASVPTSGEEHPLSLFMEDTVWPNEGMLEAYIEKSGSHYAQEMKARDPNHRHLLSVDASFRTAFSTHRRREVVLWQKVIHEEGLLRLLQNEVPARFMQPGSWMHDAMGLRDQWRSRLLRTTSWSPWH